MSSFPPPPPGAERRVHRRVDVLAQVELLRGGAVVIAAINNLSLGGAFLLHDADDVAAGEHVRIHLSAGGVDVIQDARVVRVSLGAPRGFAVAWVGAHVRTFAVIERLMRDEVAKKPKKSTAEPHPQ